VISDWISFLAYPIFLGIKGFVVVAAAALVQTAICNSKPANVCRAPTSIVLFVSIQFEMS
jgi:hypothetical protein